MSSENKKKKAKNSYTWKGKALKDKGKGIKGISFYNASQRQKDKRNKDGLIS